MTHTEQFNTIIRHLSPEDFATVRGYILDTVRAEFGPLITSLENRAEDFAPGQGTYEVDVPVRTYDLDLLTRTMQSVTFSAGPVGPILTVTLEEWESAGSPNRITITASVA